MLVAGPVPLAMVAIVLIVLVVPDSETTAQLKLVLVKPINTEDEDRASQNICPLPAVELAAFSVNAKVDKLMSSEPKPTAPPVLT